MEVDGSGVAASGLAGSRQEWSPEVAGRLRGALISFVVVMLLSMVLTISYVAGRTITVDGTPPAPPKVAAAPGPVANPPAAAPAMEARPLDPALALLQAERAAKATAVTKEAPVQAMESKPAPEGASGEAASGEALQRLEAQTTAANAARAAAVPATGGDIAAAAVPPVEEMAPGLYLQVAAVDYASAEKTAQSVRQTGLNPKIVPGPSETIFRVVVGPLAAGEALAEAKAKLAKGGFTAFGRRFP